MVALQRDRDAFLSQVRRPMPQEPTIAAHRGTTLHTWIEAHYGRVPLISADDLGPDEEGDADLERLKEIWEASEWAGRTPTDVEVDVELPLAGRVIRSRIDAVFPAGRGLAKVTVVDWKSGRPPRDEAEKAAREVQLAVYRLAWAEWKEIAVEDVDAAFYYVATDETVRPERLLDRGALEALIAG
jgi:DNA helicase-2/ATP-dependent DNA helicase PcrA